MLNLWIQYQKNATRALIQANGGEPIQSVLWSSTLTRRPDSTDDFSPSDYLVQLWWRSDDVINFDYVNRGYNVIVSNEDKLYMDCGLENWAAQLPNHCQTYISWRDMYEFDPRSHYLSFPEGQPQRVNQVCVCVCLTVKTVVTKFVGPVTDCWGRGCVMVRECGTTDCTGQTLSQGLGIC